MKYSPNESRKPFDFARIPDTIRDSILRLASDPADKPARIDLGQRLSRRPDRIRSDGGELWAWYPTVLAALATDPIYLSRPTPSPGRIRTKVAVRLAGREGVLLTGATVDEYERLFAATCPEHLPSILMQRPRPGLLVLDVLGRGTGQRAVWQTYIQRLPDGTLQEILRGEVLPK